MIKMTNRNPGGDDATSFTHAVTALLDDALSAGGAWLRLNRDLSVVRAVAIVDNRLLDSSGETVGYLDGIDDLEVYTCRCVGMGHRQGCPDRMLPR